LSRRLAVGALLGASLLWAPAASAWRPHIHAAVRYAKARHGFVSVAAIDTRGRFYGFRSGHRAPTASVLKPMLLAADLNKRHVRHQRLHRWEKRLLSPMIRRSDHDAATRALRPAGAAAVKRVARRAGMRSFQLVTGVWGLSQTTPRDQARFFYRYDRLLPRRHRAFARRLLRHIVGWQRWGIGRVRVRPWRLYFKGGWGGGHGWVDHQVAWLERRGRRVSLAIFTQHNPSHSYGNATLRGVAARLLRGLPR